MTTTVRCAGGVLAAAAFAALVACEQPLSSVAPTNPAGPGQSAAAAKSSPAGSTQSALGGAAALSQDLADLKRATASFHDIDKAASAGWSAQVTPCLTLEGQGGQGFHYGNEPLIDGAITPLQPELLLYEPRGENLHLVGVEYIIPFEAWTAASPPSLFGETFHRNEDLGLWVLHVWIWKPNPSGLFADWNPNVSCGA